MSETEVLPTDTDDAPDSAEAILTRLNQLENRVDELERENATLRERLDERPKLVWESRNPRDLMVVIPSQDKEFKLGDAIFNRALEEDVQPLIDELYELVDKVMRENIDPVDLAGSYSPTYPIEEWVAKAIDEARSEDLTRNRYRAAHVFRAFGGRAKGWNGVLRLDSTDVKQLLKSEDIDGDPNPNTVRRTMKFVARGTSEKPESERDPWDEDNLITLVEGEKRLRLESDGREWKEFMQTVEEAANQNDPSITLS